MKKLVKNLPFIYLFAALLFIFVKLCFFDGTEFPTKQIFAQALNLGQSFGLYFVSSLILFQIMWPEYIQLSSNNNLRFDLGIQCILVLLSLFFIFSISNDNYFSLQQIPQEGFITWGLITLLAVALQFLRIGSLLKQSHALLPIQKRLLFVYTFSQGVFILLNLLAFLSWINGTSFDLTTHTLATILFSVLTTLSMCFGLFRGRKSLTQNGAHWLVSNKMIAISCGLYFVTSMLKINMETVIESTTSFPLLNFVQLQAMGLFFIQVLNLIYSKIDETKSDFITEEHWVFYFSLFFGAMLLLINAAAFNNIFNNLSISTLVNLLWLIIIPATLLFYSQNKKGHSIVTASISKASYFGGIFIIVISLATLIQAGLSISNIENPAFYPYLRILTLGFGILIVSIATQIWDRILYEVL